MTLEDRIPYCTIGQVVPAFIRKFSIRPTALILEGVDGTLVPLIVSVKAEKKAILCSLLEGTDCRKGEYMDISVL